MNQDDYRDLYKKINRGWEDSVTIYKETVRKHINKDTVVMEAGAGFSNLFTEEYKLAKKVIGVDINEEYLSANPSVTEKYVAPLEEIPEIKDNSVDVVISSWVLEHINDADKVFSEINRVIKPGGKFIFLTPNALNYVLIGNRIINKRIRNFLARQLTAELEVDPMPATYLANTKGKIKKLSRTHNFNVKELRLNGDPTYLAFNKFFFWVGIIIEMIISLPILRNTKVHIIGVLEKK